LKLSQNSDLNIECWLDIDDIYLLVTSLSKKYSDEPIHIIDRGPLEFVANLHRLSSYYGDNVIQIGAVIIRSLIQDHPLQDGNKRFGMLAGSLFLENNGFDLSCSDEDMFETAMALASGNMNREELTRWIEKNVEIIEE
jgi:death-on-curing protein